MANMLAYKAVTWRFFPSFYPMITPTTSTHALKGICPHNQRHLPPQRKAFDSKMHSKAFARHDPP